MIESKKNHSGSKRTPLSINILRCYHTKRPRNNIYRLFDRSLHLMEPPELANLITDFKGGGDNIVAAIGKNSYKNGKLSINKTQYFEGIPEEVYNFHIGGYQVCQKWLKDRKGRELTEEEVEHYQKIVVALKETMRIMNEIDEVIEGLRDGMSGR